MKRRRAELHPQLDLAQCAESRVGAYARVDRKIGTFGNGFLEGHLSFGGDEGMQGAITNKMTGESTIIH